MSETWIYLIRGADGVYVGITMRPERRWIEHRSAAANSAKGVLYSAMRKHGAKVFSFELLEQHSVREEAFAAEAFWIAYLRALGAKLYNTSPGGDIILTGPCTPEHRAKIAAALKGKCKSPTHTANMSAARKGIPSKPLTAEQRAKLSSALKGRVFSHDHREKLRTASLGKKHTDASKAKVRAATLGRAVSVETGRKISAAKTLFYSKHPYSEIAKEKLRAANLGKRASTEARAAMSAGQRGRKHSPETLEKMRRARSAWWERHSNGQGD